MFPIRFDIITNILQKIPVIIVIYKISTSSYITAIFIDIFLYNNCRL